jgi:uncharacterized membrane protein YdjX (TVP38/TMEM64 family)
VVRAGRVRLLAISAVLAAAALALLALAVPFVDVAGSALEGDGDAVREALQSAGVAGAAALAALIVAHAVLPYPAGLATAAAGYVYGFALAAPLVLAAWLASALAAYGVARGPGRGLAVRLAGRRLAAAERQVTRAGAIGLLAARLVPVIPFNAVCYASGILRVPLRTYTWTTLVGIAPFTLGVTYLGSRLATPDGTDWRLWVASGALLVLLVLAHRLRAARRRQPLRRAARRRHRPKRLAQVSEG